MVFIDVETRLRSKIAYTSNVKLLDQTSRLLRIILEPSSQDGSHKFRKVFKDTQDRIVPGTAHVRWSQWLAKQEREMVGRKSSLKCRELFMNDVMMVRNVLGLDAALILGLSHVLPVYRKQSQKHSNPLLRALMDFLDEKAENDNTAATFRPGEEPLTSDSGTPIVDASPQTPKLLTQVQIVHSSIAGKTERDLSIRFPWSGTEAIALMRGEYLLHSNEYSSNGHLWSSYEVSILVLDKWPFKELSKSITQTSLWEEERAQQRPTTACLRFVFPNGLPGNQCILMYVDALIPEITSLRALFN